MSLGEILISIAVIGILMVILIPIMRSAKPSETEALHKKAVYIVERVVNELSSDEYLYPAGGEVSGLSNVSSVTLNGETHSGATKFCTLFASRINKKPGTDVVCMPNQVSVTSIEGFDWYLPVSDFQNGAETLMVDVNGAGEPNTIGIDRFEYKIQPGAKKPVKEVPFLTVTGAPPVRPDIGTPPAPAEETKTGLESYSISCNGAGATVYGNGENKVNGNYTLVAIPKKGYKCNWFTKQVTVKDANVTDCALTCTPDTLRPTLDGEPIVPPPDDDDDGGDDDEKTYCINVTMTGEQGKCSVEGAGCGKTNGIYTVNIKSTDAENYKARWITGSSSVTINNADVNMTAECGKIEKTECHRIIVNGDTENCPVALPDKNCPTKEGDYKNGTYKLTVTPNKGFTYNNSTTPSSQDVSVDGNDAVFNLECKPVNADMVKVTVYPVSICPSLDDIKPEYKEDIKRHREFVELASASNTLAAYPAISDVTLPDGSKYEVTEMIQNKSGGELKSVTYSVPRGAKFTVTAKNTLPFTRKGGTLKECFPEKTAAQKFAWFYIAGKYYDDKLSHILTANADMTIAAKYKGLYQDLCGGLISEKTVSLGYSTREVSSNNEKNKKVGIYPEFIHYKGSLKLNPVCTKVVYDSSGKAVSSKTNCSINFPTYIYRKTPSVPEFLLHNRTAMQEEYLSSLGCSLESDMDGFKGRTFECKNASYQSSVPDGTTHWEYDENGNKRAITADACYYLNISVQLPPLEEPEGVLRAKYVNGKVHMKNGGPSMNNNWIIVTTFALSEPVNKDTVITVKLKGGGIYTYTIQKGNMKTAYDPMTVTLPGGADPVTSTSISDTTYENRILIMNDDTSKCSLRVWLTDLRKLHCSNCGRVNLNYSTNCTSLPSLTATIKTDEGRTQYHETIPDCGGNWSSGGKCEIDFVGEGEVEGHYHYVVLEHKASDLDNVDVILNAN